MAQGLGMNIKFGADGSNLKRNLQDLKGTIRNFSSFSKAEMNKIKLTDIDKNGEKTKKYYDDLTRLAQAHYDRERELYKAYVAQQRADSNKSVRIQDADARRVANSQAKLLKYKKQMKDYAIEWSNQVTAKEAAAAKAQTDAEIKAAKDKANADKIARDKIIADSQAELDAQKLHARKTAAYYRRTLTTLKWAQKGFNEVSKLTMPITYGAGAALLYAAKKAMDYKSQMMEVGNLFKRDAPTLAEGNRELRNMGKLYAQNATLSNQFAVKQNDLANVEKNLAQQGYTSNQVLGMMPSIIKGSIASGQSLGDVEDNLSKMIDAFNLRGKNAVKVAKQLSNETDYTVDNSKASLQDITTAISYSGDVAKNAGIKDKELLGIIGELANKGVDASQSGTGLRKIITSLQAIGNASSSSAKKVKKLNQTWENENRSVNQQQDKLNGLRKSLKSYSNQHSTAYDSAIKKEKSLKSEIENTNISIKQRISLLEKDTAKTNADTRKTEDSKLKTLRSQLKEAQSDYNNFQKEQLLREQRQQETLQNDRQTIKSINEQIAEKRQELKSEISAENNNIKDAKDQLTLDLIQRNNTADEDRNSNNYDWVENNQQIEKDRENIKAAKDKIAEDRKKAAEQIKADQERKQRELKSIEVQSHINNETVEINREVKKNKIEKLQKEIHNFHFSKPVKVDLSADSTLQNLHRKLDNYQKQRLSEHNLAIKLSNDHSAKYISIMSKISEATQDLRNLEYRRQHTEKYKTTTSGGVKSNPFEKLGITPSQIETKSGGLKPLSQIFALIKNRMNKRGMNKTQQGALMKAMFGQTGMETATALLHSLNGRMGVPEFSKRIGESDKNNYVNKMAAANMKTPSKQFDRMVVQAENGLQAIGMDLLPEINKGLKIANKSLKNVNWSKVAKETENAIKTLIRTSKPFVKILEKVANWFDKLTPKQKEWIAVALVTVGPISKVAGALTKVLGVGVKVISVFSKWRDAVKIEKMAGDLKDLKSGTSGVSGAVETLSGKTKLSTKLFKMFGASSTSIFGLMGSKLKKLFSLSHKGHLKTISDLKRWIRTNRKLGNIFSLVKSKLVNSFKAIGGKFSGLLDLIKSHGTNLFNKFKDLLGKFKGKLSTILNFIKSGVVKGITKGGSLIAGVLKKMLGVFKIGFEFIFGALKKLMLFLAANPYVLAITLVIGALVLLYKHFKPFREFVNWIAKEAWQLVKTGLKMIINLFKKVANFYKNWFKTIAKGIHKVFKWLGNLFKPKQVSHKVHVDRTVHTNYADDQRVRKAMIRANAYAQELKNKKDESKNVLEVLKNIRDTNESIMKFEAAKYGLDKKKRKPEIIVVKNQRDVDRELRNMFG